MASVSEQLADAYRVHHVGLLRYDAWVRARALVFLKELERELVSRLVDIDPTAPARTAYQRQRLERLLEQARALITEAYGNAGNATSSYLYDLGRREAEWAVGAINTAAGVKIAEATITAAQLRSILSDVLIEGGPSAEWWSRQAEKLRQQFADQIRLGMAQGETIDDMVRRIRGKATGKRSYYWDPKTGERKVFTEFSGGIMDIGTRQAEALVRTSVQAVAADAQMALYRANADLMRGVQHLSTLDTRTCPICMGYSGAAWTLKGEPLEGTTLPYRLIPLHWSCRCDRIPILKTWRELGFDLDEAPPGTRASMDGQVAADMTFDQWLKTKPKSVVDEMLGKGRAQLWLDGRITMRDLLDQRGRPLSLDELHTKAA